MTGQFETESERPPGHHLADNLDLRQQTTDPSEVAETAMRRTKNDFIKAGVPAKVFDDWLREAIKSETNT